MDLDGPVGGRNGHTECMGKRASICLSLADIHHPARQAEADAGRESLGHQGKLPGSFQEASKAECPLATEPSSGGSCRSAACCGEQGKCHRLTQPTLDSTHLPPPLPSTQDEPGSGHWLPERRTAAAGQRPRRPPTDVSAPDVESLYPDSRTPRSDACSPASAVQKLQSLSLRDRSIHQQQRSR